ncbi:MAG: TetR/AcrR family transcriptional regulator [Bdellovibrionaceae bacterium]|nr:TetR/AcrR family transcriptional regulator [Pseudobdellovibrionaceae bacterium]
MQIKKDDVRMNIAATALKLFCQRGFAETSMSDIAHSAKISTGNIYRYYRDKEALFAEILPDKFIRSIKTEINQLMILASHEVDFYKKTEGEYQAHLEHLIQILFENRERILILLSADPQSPHRRFRQTLEALLVRQAIRYLRQVHGRRNLDATERRLLQMIYRSFVENSFQILRQAATEKSYRHQLRRLRSYHLPGLKSYFEELSQRGTP